VQRRKDEIGTADPGHQTVSVGLGSIHAFLLCVFAALRLCVQFPLHGYGLAPAQNNFPRGGAIQTWWRDALAGTVEGNWELVIEIWFFGFKLAELGQAVGGLDYTSARMAIHRLRRRLERDSALRTALKHCQINLEM
jgi:hypothetical protein